mmetsp:Transcript_20123/g.29868  ORF Transcript_20123/g.29868 Transcript_20123/m.29868 type:complete len:258 (+) Transcript_20123:215-988(+)
MSPSTTTTTTTTCSFPLEILTTPTVISLDQTPAILAMRAYGCVKPDAVQIVILNQVAVNTGRINAGIQHAVHHAVQHVAQHAILTAIQLAVQLGARLAAAIGILPSIVVSMQDVLRPTDYGVMLETAVPLPGGASKTPLIAKFVLRGGIVMMATGAQMPSIEVLELVWRRLLSRKSRSASVTLLTSVLTWVMRQLVRLPTVIAADSGRLRARSGGGIVVTLQLTSARDKSSIKSRMNAEAPELAISEPFRTSAEIKF